MAAYSRVYFLLHLQADCQEPGSAPEPYARYSSVVAHLYLFYFSGVKTPPVLERKPSPRRVPYSSRTAYDIAGRRIKGRGAVVSSHMLCSDSDGSQPFLCPYHTSHGS